MAIKLDMANAFDRVEHDFLFKVMKKFGFNQEFLSWTGACIASPWITPLLNGRPAPFFRTSRRLRQVCPLSPLLYVIMAETLNRTLEWESINGSIPGIKIAQVTNVSITHNLLMIRSSSGASQIMARRINQVLNTFLLVSSGLLNKAKCQIFVWNVSANNRVGIAQILGFGISSDWKTFKYMTTFVLKIAPW
jgi:hypothetical protein